MLGHLVSVSRQSPPDFGIATRLRDAASQLLSLLHTVFTPKHSGHTHHVARPR